MSRISRRQLRHPAVQPEFVHHLTGAGLCADRPGPRTDERIEIRLLNLIDKALAPCLRKRRPGSQNPPQLALPVCTHRLLCAEKRLNGFGDLCRLDGIRLKDKALFDIAQLHLGQLVIRGIKAPLVPLARKGGARIGPNNRERAFALKVLRGGLDTTFGPVSDPSL